MTRWTEAAMAQLRAEWAAVPQQSASTIARKLKMTRWAVAQKARRLGLEERPSPIKPANPETRRRLIPSAGRSTLAPLPSLADQR